MKMTTLNPPGQLDEEKINSLLQMAANEETAYPYDFVGIMQPEVASKILRVLRLLEIDCLLSRLIYSLQDALDSQLPAG